jgi:hypothetical protein
VSNDGFIHFENGQSMLQRTVNSAVSGQSICSGQSMLQWTVNAKLLRYWAARRLQCSRERAANSEVSAQGRCRAAVPRPRIVLAHLPDWIARLTYCGEQTTIRSCTLSLVEQAWQKMTLRRRRSEEIAWFLVRMLQRELRPIAHDKQVIGNFHVIWYVCLCIKKSGSNAKSRRVVRRLLNVGDDLDRTPFQEVPPRINCPAGAWWDCLQGGDPLHPPPSVHR